MIDMALCWVMWIVLAPLAHEFGHWATARALGYKIRFYREGFRFCWDNPPYKHEWHDILVNQAGFGFELLGLIPAFLMGGWPYLATTILHWWAYPWYAGKKTDFDSIVKNGKIGR